MDKTKKIQSILAKLPDCAGVYLFLNANRQTIYAGKASSLKSRVKSYFLGARNQRPIELMIHEVADIKWEPADSALEAAVLESNYIKRLRPKYNIYWKDDKSWNYFLVSKDDYPKLSLMREHELKRLSPGELRRYQYVFGPYPGLNTKAALKILRRLFLISFCAPGSKRSCLYRQMGLCLGVCTGEISAAEYRRKVIRPLVMFFKGKKKILMGQTARQMAEAAKKNDFEEAARLRDQLRALGRIRDIALINESFVKDSVGKKGNLRVEGYDVSNLGASGRVGSMVVFDERGPVKSEYRKFNIKKSAGQNDVACLAEIFERRLRRADWPRADVWLIDGGLSQVNRAVKIASGRVPIIVGIAKGPKRRKNEFIIGTKNAPAVNWVEKNKNLLIRVRDEAHRFALSFQRQKRRLPR